MLVTVETDSRRVPVTILAIHGAVDASNFEEVIAAATTAYRHGARHFLFDLTDMPFMGSSGLVAILTVVMLARRQAPPEQELALQAFHSFDPEIAGGPQPQVKLLNPRIKVRRTLGLTGLDTYFDIFTDREAALESF